MAGGVKLAALEPSHPAAFLAALGALDLAATGCEVRLHWERQGVTWRPALTTHEQLGPDELIEMIAAAHDGREIECEIAPDNVHKLDRDRVRLELSIDDPARRPMRAALLAELPLTASGRPPISPFAIYQPGQGRNFTKVARKNSSLGGGTLRRRLREALFGPWRYSKKDVNPLRWDPVTSLQERAYERDASTNMGTRAVPGLMLLAVRGLRFYPLVTEARWARPRGWVRTADLRDDVATRWARSFIWPIWEEPVGVDEVELLLSHPEISARRPNYSALRANGVTSRFVADLTGPSSGVKALSFGQRV